MRAIFSSPNLRLEVRPSAASARPPGMTRRICLLLSLLPSLAGCATLDRAAVHFNLKAPPRPAGHGCVRYMVSMRSTELRSGGFSDPEFSAFVAQFGEPVYTAYYDDEVKGGTYVACPEDGSIDAGIASRVEETVRHLVPKDSIQSLDLVATSATGPSKTRAAGGVVHQYQWHELYYRGCPFKRMDGKYGDACLPVAP